MHLGRTADIVLPLLFAAEDTPGTSLLTRQLVLFIFLGREAWSGRWLPRRRKRAALGPPHRAL